MTFGPGVDMNDTELEKKLNKSDTDAEFRWKTRLDPVTGVSDTEIKTELDKAIHYA